MLAHRGGGNRHATGCASVWGLRQDRLAVAASANVSNLREHAVLRFVAQSPRQQTCRQQWPSGDRLCWSRRTLAILLPGRCVRRILTPAAGNRPPLFGDGRRNPALGGW